MVAGWYPGLRRVIEPWPTMLLSWQSLLINTCSLAVLPTAGIEVMRHEIALGWVIIDLIKLNR